MPAVRRRLRRNNRIIVGLIDESCTCAISGATRMTNDGSRSQVHRSVTDVGLLKRVRKLQIDMPGERIHVTVGRNCFRGRILELS